MFGPTCSKLQIIVITEISPNLCQNLTVTACHKQHPKTKYLNMSFCEPSYSSHLYSECQLKKKVFIFIHSFCTTNVLVVTRSISKKKRSGAGSRYIELCIQIKIENIFSYTIYSWAFKILGLYTNN